MSSNLASSIISKGLAGSLKKPESFTVSKPLQSTQSSSQETIPSGWTRKSMFSPVPKSVTVKDGITTVTLPDGSQFKMDAQGNPVRSDRDLLTSATKSYVRGGSFADTQEEVDHKISIALGGTNTLGNLEALKNKKTPGQFVADFFTGNDREAGEYKPEKRQAGKYLVEDRAIQKYQAGEIGLWEAMAAIQHYDDKAVVNDFLGEEFFKDAKPAGEEKKGFLPAVLNVGKEVAKRAILGPAAKLFSPIVDKVVEGQVESAKEFLKETPRKQALLVASAPVRLTAGSLAKFLLELDLEAADSDLSFTPETELQELLIGKGTIERITKSSDIYGSVQQVVEKKLSERGLDPKQSRAAGLTSAVALGLVFENPLGTLGGKAAKEGVEKALKSTIAKELGEDLSEKVLKEIGTEAARITSLKTSAEKTEAFKTFVSKFQVDRPLFEEAKKYKSAEEFVQARGETYYHGTNADFDQFSLDTTGKRTMLLQSENITPNGIFFTRDRSAAKNFGSKIKEVKLDVKNPFLSELDVKNGEITNDEAFTKALNSIVEKDSSGKEFIEHGADRIFVQRFEDGSIANPEDFIIPDEGLIWPLLDKKPFVDSLKKQGFDMVIVAEGADNGLSSYMVFSPDQIKTKSQLTDIWNKAHRITASKTPTSSPTRTSLLGELPVPATPELAETVAKTQFPTRPQLLEGRGKRSAEMDSYEATVTQKGVNVKEKVNLLDYVRTPDRVLQKLGFAEESKLLRKGYEAYTKELPKNIDKVTAWSKQVPPESNARIFNYLDGKEVALNEVELKVAGEIKTWLAEWADRLGLPKDNRIASYITHIFDEEIIAKEFDEDLAKIIAKRIPGEVYDPFLEKRLGALGYKQDTWAALDAYVKRATRKVHMDEPLSAIKAKAGGSLETSALEQSQFEYIQDYVARINLRPTKIDNLIDNTVKSLIGYRWGQRPITRWMKLLRQMTYRGMLGLNPASALRNLSQGINTYAVLGEKYTTIGYAKLFQKGAMKELADTGVLAEKFVQDRVLSATKKTMEKVDKVLFSFFETAEKINRGAAYFGAKSKALNEGKTLEEAIEFAKETVRKTQFSFGAIDAPLALQGDIVKTMTQFQTFTVKQIEFLAELALDKNFVGLIRYAVAGGAFVYTVGQAFGMELQDIVPSFRLGTPPSLKAPAAVVGAAVDAPDKYGQKRTWREKLSDIGKSLIGLIPGGSQAKKTIEGARALQEGKVTSASGKTKKFSVEQTPANVAKALLFGKYATKEGQAYIAGDDPLQDLAERLYNLALDDQAASKEEFDAYILEHPEDEKKLKSRLKDLASGITEEEKLIRKLGVQDGARAQVVFETINALETREEKVALYEDWKAKGIITASIEKQLKELQAALADTE